MDTLTYLSLVMAILAAPHLSRKTTDGFMRVLFAITVMYAVATTLLTLFDKARAALQAAGVGV